MLQYPKEHRDTCKQILKSRADSVSKKNQFSNGVGVVNKDTDILYYSLYYAEPKINYEQQKSFWLEIEQDMASMANDAEFHQKDVALTKQFIEPLRAQLQG